LARMSSRAELRRGVMPTILAGAIRAAGHRAAQRGM
jgi:hypothetical protein